VIAGTGPNGPFSYPAELAVGSGHNGITFLGHEDSVTWATLRLTYYATRHTWQFSPHQTPEEASSDQPAGREMAPEEAALCLRCHVTELKQTPYDLDIAHSLLGVGCEACHGPGRAHVESAQAMAAGKAKSIVAFAALSPQDPPAVEKVCSPCHSTEHGVLGITEATAGKLQRFQASALEQSRCFRESKALSCATCHDPHTDVVSNRSAEEAICLSCHKPRSAAITPVIAKTVAARSCPVNPRTGCIPCHMPPALLPDAPSYPFHNHWIKVYKNVGNPMSRAAPHP